MFTRGHYIAIAKIIKESETKYQVAQELAQMFQEDNDRFDVKKFFNACGITVPAQEVKA